jgi:hypothetical protein
MNLSATLVFISLFAITLSGCGGSSESSGAPNPPSLSLPPTPEEPSTTAPALVIANVASQTPNALKLAASTLADERYKGNNDNTAATMDKKNTQEAFTNLLTKQKVMLPTGFTGFLFANSTRYPVELADNYFCTQDDDRIARGLIRYTGSLDRDGNGRLFIELTNCLLSGNGVRINGNVSVIVTGKVKLTARATSLSMYYDNVSWERDGKQYSISGYSTELQRKTQGLVFYERNQYVAYEAGDQTILIDAVSSTHPSTDDFSTSINQIVDFRGDYFTNDNGKASFTFEGNIYLSRALQNIGGQLSLSGTNTTALQFETPRVKYLEDNNNDGVFDKGTYFRNYDDLIAINDNADNKVVDIDLLSIPPYVYGLTILSPAEIFTNTPIQANQNSARDVDTPFAQLDISYMWYINDILVAGVSGPTLPAFSAIVGDTVAVSITVSDLSNTVKSQLSSAVTINNIPIEFETTSVPKTATAGERIEFTAQMFDPDNVDPNLPITALLSGPSGASIDEKGLVTWDVPQNDFVPFRTFTFTFALPSVGDNEAEKLALDIKVLGDISTPIVKTGRILPDNGFSMSIGDYTGDGQNEILTTDNLKTIALLKYQNGQYSQQWMYPYEAVTGDNKIIQLLAYNIDDDLPLEIIVITESRIGLINGLNNTMTILYETEKIIEEAAIGDINQDGIADLAFFSRDGAYGDWHLQTIAFDRPAPIAIAQALDEISDVGRIIFGNVDEDPQLELIDSAGRVFETSDWSLQWVYEARFGYGGLSTSDFNNDGVDEIISMSGGIKAYSALEKRQLDHIPNYNATKHTLIDIDSDNIKEIVTNNVVEGVLYIHKFDGNTLTEYSAIDHFQAQLISMISGDSNNDGKEEILWVNNGIHIESFDDGEIIADERVIIRESANYLALGWDTKQSSEDLAVFLLGSAVVPPKTGASIGLLKGNGEFKLSNIIVDKTDKLRLAALSDFNNDGITDIFLPDAKNGFKQDYVAIDLLSFATQWQETTFDEPISTTLIAALDVNEDTHEDAIYIDSYNGDAIMKVFDAQNASLITTYLFKNEVNDMMPINANGNTGVLVATGALSYLQFIGDSFVEQASFDIRCDNVEWINIDDDSDLEVLCLQTFSGIQQVIVFELSTTEFTEVRRFPGLGRILDIKADPSTASQQNILVSLYDLENTQTTRRSRSAFVAKLDTYGNKIWTSAPLVGRVRIHSLAVRNNNNNLEILLSTDSAMYWFK